MVKISNCHSEPRPQKSMLDDKKEAELLVNKLYIYIRFDGLAYSRLFGGECAVIVS